MQPTWLLLVSQCIRVLAFLGLVVLPVTWVCLRRCTGLPTSARLALGAAAGFSLFVVGACTIGRYALDAVPAFWLAECAGAVWLGRRPPANGRLAGIDLDRNNVRRHDRATPRHQSDGGESGVESSTPQGGTPLRSTTSTRRKIDAALVALPLVAGVVVEFYPLHRSVLPLGVDSAFHCTVGQRALDAGRATDNLWPLEDLRLNYPVGSHLWLAIAARWTGLRVHEVFRYSFVIALVGTGLMVAASAEKLFGSARHGTAAAFAFVFGGYQASFFPYTWGGLPNALAMWQGLAALYAVAALPGFGGLALAALSFGGAALTHHHAGLALFGGATIASLAIGSGFPAHRALARRIAIGLAAGAVVAAGYLVPLIGRAAELGATGILSYAEPFHWPWQELWGYGPGFVTLACVGLVTVTAHHCATLRVLLIAMVLSWVLAFLALDYGGRVVTAWLWGTASTPFTPSRFLLDAQYLLAVFAGGGLVELVGVGPKIMRARGAEAASAFGRPPAGEKLNEPVARGSAIGWVLTLVICTVMVGWTARETAPRWVASPSDALVPIGDWMDRHLPADALVRCGPGGIWLTYTARRETTSLFIPVSEPTTERQWIKQSLLHDPASATWDEWRARLGKPIYELGPAVGPYLDREPIYANESFGVYELTGS